MGTKHTVRRNKGELEITIISAFLMFIEDKKAHNLSKSSLIGYQDSFKYFMDYFNFDEHTPLNVVNNEMFKAWTLDLLERDLRITSINHYLRHCKVFFNWCINNALFPLSELKIDMLRGQENPIKCFPDDELALILQKPVNNNDFVEWRTWSIVNWVLATGNRAGTIVEVKIGDIDFKNKEISLRHTKNKKTQIIPLSSKLMGLVSVYIVNLEKIGQNRFVRLHLNKIEELLFTPNDEESENIDQMATRIAKNLEIAPERFSMPIEDTNSMEYEGNYSAVNENTSETKIVNVVRYY